MGNDGTEAIKYFRKVLKHQLGISLEEPSSAEAVGVSEKATSVEEATIETPTEVSTMPPEVSSIPPGEIQETEGIPKESIQEVSTVGSEVVSTPSVEAQEREMGESRIVTTQQSEPYGAGLEEKALEISKEISMSAITPDLTDVTQALMNEIRSLREFLLEKISAIEKRVEKLEMIIPKIMEGVSYRREVARAPTVDHHFYTEETEILIREAQQLLQSQDVSLEKLVKIEAIEWQILKALESGRIKPEDVKEVLQDLRMEINRLRRVLIGQA